jgi:hypothetical protein
MTLAIHWPLLSKTPVPDPMYLATDTTALGRTMGAGITMEVGRA